MVKIKKNERKEFWNAFCSRCEENYGTEQHEDSYMTVYIDKDRYTEENIGYLAGEFDFQANCARGELGVVIYVKKNDTEFIRDKFLSYLKSKNYDAKDITQGSTSKKKAEKRIKVFLNEDQLSTDELAAKTLELLEELVNESIVFMKRNPSYFPKPERLTSKTKKKENNDNIKSKKAIAFNKRVIDSSWALKFFYYTICKFKDMLSANNKINGHDYFQSTDINLMEEGFAEQQFIFKELAFHAQNSTIGGSIRFDKVKDNLRAFTKNYHPQEFLGSMNYTYNPDTNRIDVYDESVIKFAQEVEQISDFTSESSAFLTFKYYVRDLIAAAKYLVDANIDTHEALINDFESNISGFNRENKGNNNFYDIFSYFIKRVPYGFKEALTFDFLKEFDSVVFDYPKADLHVKRAMVYVWNEEQNISKLKNKLLNFNVDGTIKTLDAMDLYMELVCLIRQGYVNAHGTHTELITNYLLDKMIYVICSGNLYMGENPKHDYNYKIPYLKNIRFGENTDSAVNNDEMIDIIDSFLLGRN